MEDSDTSDVETVNVCNNGAYNIVANNVHPKMGDLDTINMQNTGPRGGVYGVQLLGQQMQIWKAREPWLSLLMMATPAEAPMSPQEGRSGQETKEGRKKLQVERMQRKRGPYWT